MSLPITSRRAAGRSRCDGIDRGADLEWLPVHPTVPFELASGNDWEEETPAERVSRNERLLWVDLTR